MAIPPFKTVLPFKGHGHNMLTSKNPVATPFLGRKLPFTGLVVRREHTTRTPMKSRVSSKNDSSPPMVSELESEKEKGDEENTIAKKPKRVLADTWQEIHGQDDWAGMLDPINPLLRSELIRYGEMAQACYDAFDFDPYSKYCGSCRFKPSMLFQCLGLTQYGYEVTRYLYATYNINLPNFFKRSLWPESWSPTANWIGYVAVSNDETSAHLRRRDITIVWRGTVTRLEWIADLMDFQRPIAINKIPCPDMTVKVESGFLHVYTNKDNSCQFCKYSAREQILAEVKQLIQKYAKEDLSITITGHSLGSALAILNAYDIAEIGVDVTDDGRVVPICVFSFSGPRVGNARFKERLEGLGVKVLRVVNVHDKVPKVPGIFFNEHMPPMLQKLAEMSPLCYSHVGVELALDHKNSPFLKETSDLACFHNLEAHLHLLDGYQGKGRRFMLASRRDIALVNKASDFLKDYFLVPPNWWQTENRGLIRNDLGRWMQHERFNLEVHPQDVHHHLRQLGLACDD